MWVGGSDRFNTGPVHGTRGAAADDFTPGARSRSASWKGADGSFWIFGGVLPGTVPGNGSQGGRSRYGNDLWRYKDGTWTWVNGNADGYNAAGIYGTRGAAADANQPGARHAAQAAADADGTAWVHAGQGVDSLGQEALLNDLWRWDGSRWTWISGGMSEAVGGNIPKVEGKYGTRRVHTPGAIPFGRDTAAAWTDAAGDLWVFGGFEHKSLDRRFGDLWKFCVSCWKSGDYEAP